MANYQQAFVADDMIFYGNRFVGAAVAPERDGTELMISIYPISAPAELAGLEIVITQSDLAEVQKVLGENRPRADYEPDNFGVALALAALERIAELDQVKNEDDTWKTIAMRAIEIAQDALGRMEEYATATDS